MPVSRLVVVQWHLLRSEKLRIEDERNPQQIVRHFRDHFHLYRGRLCDHNGRVEIRLQDRSSRSRTASIALGTGKRRAETISKEKVNEYLSHFFLRSLIGAFFSRLTEKDFSVLHWNRCSAGTNKQQYQSKMSFIEMDRKRRKSSEVMSIRREKERSEYN